MFRFLAGLAGVLVIGGFAAMLTGQFGYIYGATPQQLGAGLFTALHVASCVTLGIFCPLLTADCLSRERREGTLGLLFLTPLTAGGIVGGKAAGQVIRAFSLWLAFVPMLMVPLLLGGLSVADFSRAIAVEAIVGIVALSAGLAASALCRRWIFSVVLATVILGFFAAAVVAACDAGFWAVALYMDPTIFSNDNADRMLSEIIGALVLTPVGVNSSSGASILSVGVLPPGWLIPSANVAIATELFAACVIALGVFRFARRRIHREWKPEGRSAVTVERIAKWTRPVVSLSWLKRRRASLLDRRPIRWLISRTVAARLAMWALPGGALLGWLVLLVSLFFDTGMSAHDLANIGIVQPLILIPPLVLFSAGSWRQEIEEGTLELFLVTPLPPERLITDRARALWIAFGPTLALLLLIPLPFIASYNQAQYYSYERPWDAYLCIGGVVATSIFALPFCGIRCAFRRLNPISGSILSGLIAFGLPAVLATMITFAIWGLVDWAHESESVWFSSFCMCQIGVGIAWWKLCIRDLSTRGFMLKPFQRAAKAAQASA